MALVVNSTSVDNGASNIYLDATIKLTFNKAINPASLTLANIILYIVDASDTITGSASVVVKQDDLTPNIVEIIPQKNLTSNTKYILFVMGDHEIGDATLQGIIAEDNDVLDGNYMISFTSGSQVQDITNEPPVIHTDPGNGGNMVSTSGYISIINTDPYNGQSPVTSLNELVMYFDYPVMAPSIPVNVVVEHAIWPYTAVDALYQPSGFLLGSGYYTPDHLEYHIPVQQEFRTLANNMAFGVYADAVLDFPGYSWFFTSKFWPAYADVRQVRMETNSIFASVPDAIIWMKIYANSRYYDDVTGNHFNNETEIPYAVNRWVVCKTILDLYNTVLGGATNGGNVTRKTLGDLTITYGSSTANKTVPDYIQNCADKNWAAITGATGVLNTVKSGDTSLYPGHTRRQIPSSVRRRI